MTEITVLTKDLRRALEFAIRAISRNLFTRPLQLAHISVRNGCMLVRSTNLDVLAGFKIHAIGDDVAFLLDPFLALRLIKGARDTIIIRPDAGTTLTPAIEIVVDGLIARLPHHDGISDFPLLSLPHHMPHTTAISLADLRRGMIPVSASISREASRYHLDGIYIESEDHKLRMVASDGWRMSIYDFATAYDGPGLIVTRETCAMLLAVARDTVTVEAWEDRIRFSGGDWSMLCKPVDGKFPTYRKMIPPQSDAITAVLAHAAICRIPVDNGYPGSITIEGGTAIAATDAGVFTAPVKASGAAITFSLRYLRDITAHAGQVTITAAGPMEPARITTKDPALLHILMPMKVPMKVPTKGQA